MGEIGKHGKMLDLETKIGQACSINDKEAAYDAFHEFRAAMDSSYESMWDYIESRVKEKGWYEEFMRGK